MQIEIWSIDRPIPFARNPRTITPEAIDSLAGVIKEYGFRVPVIVDEEGVIIAGHTRILAARKLGMTEIPVHVARGLTKAQVRGLRLADNRVAGVCLFLDKRYSVSARCRRSEKRLSSETRYVRVSRDFCANSSTLAGNSGSST